MKIFKNSNFWFNVFILVGMLAAVVTVNVFKLQAPDARKFMLVLASIGALMGVVNTVLSANGHILTFLFGLMDVTIASIVALDSSLHGGDPVWGNFALHVFYFLPMQFVGWRQWRKRGAGSHSPVMARTLMPKTRGIVISSVVAGVATVYAVLCFVGTGGHPFSSFRAVILFDAVVFVLNIAGQVLMSMAYMEQWYVWILVNVFSISLWGTKAMSSPDSSYTVVMVVKYIFYLMNSLNGLRIWRGLSRNADSRKL